jgi:hypothetical protein
VDVFFLEQVLPLPYPDAAVLAHGPCKFSLCSLDDGNNKNNNANESLELEENRSDTSIKSPGTSLENPGCLDSFALLFLLLPSS